MNTTIKAPKMTTGTNRGYLDLNTLQVVRRPNPRKSIIRKIAKFVSFFLILYFFSGCQRDFFCYYQTNEVNMRIPYPDKLGHYPGKVINKFGDLMVDWETGMKPKK